MSEFDDDRWVRVRESVIDDGERRIKELEAELAKTKRDLHECGKYLADAKMDATAADAQRIEVEGDLAHLRACLKRLEYVRHTDGGRVHEFCPACGFCPGHGHAPDCWLAAELKEGK